MGNLRAITAAVAVLFVGASSARGENVALQANPQGVQSLERLLPVLTRNMLFSSAPTKVHSCSDRPATIALEDGAVDLRWSDTQIYIDDDRIHVETVVDLDVDGEVEIDNLGCFLDSKCQVSFRSRNIDLSTDIAVTTNPDGTLALEPVNTVVKTEATEVFDVDISGCSVGELAETLIDATTAWALESLGDKLGTAIAGGLSGLLRELPLAIPSDLKVDSYSMQSSFEYSDIDPFNGVSVGAGVAVVPRFESPPALKEGQRAPDPTEPAIAGNDVADFQVAVSDQLVSSVLRQAWWDGLFSRLVRDSDPTFDIASKFLSEKFGIAEGTLVNVSLAVDGQPIVSFGRKYFDEIAITLPDTTIELTTRSPSASQGSMRVNTSAHIKAGFRVDETGGLILEIRELRVDRLKISAGAVELEADPARMEQMIVDLILPTLGSSLEQIPMAPVMAPTEDLYVWIKHLGASGGWLRASFDLWAPTPDDTTAPETIVEDTSVIRAGLVSLPVGGEDDFTPAPLLRYKAWLDGKLLSKEPTLPQHTRFSIEDGEHVLELAAVDLNGNEDPEPARVELIVDGIPPTINVKEGPGAIIPRGPVDARWSSSDDRPGVRTYWRIYELGKGGGEGEMIEEGEADASGDLHFEGLRYNKLYVLRITAEDEAGNVTSKEMGFGFEGGCSTGGSGRGLGLFAVIMFVALGGRRRRKASC